MIQDRQHLDLHLRPEESGISWSPERQIIFHRGQVYSHEGAINTDPSHDLAHALVAANEHLIWLPEGSLSVIRIAEYNAVFLEHWFHDVYMCLTNGVPGPEEILGRIIAYSRWFVEQHFAPFPISAEEAYRQFCSGINAESVVGLSPIYFEQKRAESQCDFKQRQWDVRFLSHERPTTDAAGAAFSSLVARHVEAMTRRGYRV